VGSNWTDKALRKLDALCAERVMGWSLLTDEEGPMWMDDSRDSPVFIECGEFDPSYGWMYAGQVWQKFQAVREDGENGHLCLHTYQETDARTEKYETKYRCVAVWDHKIETKESEVVESTGPLAITLAAVAACSGKTVEEIEREAQQ